MRRFFASLFLSAVGAFAGSPETLTPQAADSLVKASAKAPGSLTLLDVRTPEEFAQGHLRRALLCDVKSSDFEAKVAKLPRASRYLLYCRSGHRSGMAKHGIKVLAGIKEENPETVVKDFVAGLAKVVELAPGEACCEGHDSEGAHERKEGHVCYCGH